jgi:hypothetical protein
MATGLGNETLWLCPTLDQTNPYDDLSTEGNNGTKVGNVSVVADTASGGSHAFSFPGDMMYGDYIDFSSCGITSGSSHTVAMWAYQQQFSNAVLWYAGQTNGLRFSTIMGEPYSDWYVGQTSNYLQAGYVDDSVWQHVCYTYDGSDVYLYVDGSYEADQSDSPVSYSEQQVNLGRYGLDGKIDDFRCFDRVLTTTEIGLLASERGYEPAATGVHNPFANKIFSPGQRIIR